MPDNKKQAVQARIDHWTLTLAGITPGTIYARIRQEKVYKRIFLAISSLPLISCVLVDIVSAIINSEWDWDDTLFFLTAQMPFALLGGAIEYYTLRRVGKWAFSFATVNDAFKRLRKPVAYSFLLYIIPFSLIFATALFSITKLSGSLYRDVMIALFICSIPLIAVSMVAMTMFTCLALVVVVLTVRYPILLTAEVLYRIATYPKGAWSALMLIATVGFGIGKLLV